jgi:hypothetical protein
MLKRRFLVTHTMPFVFPESKMVLFDCSNLLQIWDLGLGRWREVEGVRRSGEWGGQTLIET